MEFPLGGAHELTDPAVRIVLATDAQGRIQAVTSWRPLFGQKRRRRRVRKCQARFDSLRLFYSKPPSFPLPPSA